MRNTLLGAGLITIMILTSMILMTVGGRMTRETEVSNALDRVAKSAVETSMEKNDFTINDNEEFVACFLQEIINEIGNNSDIEVKIANVDYEKGLLNVKIIQHFKNPNGNDGKAELDKTVIFTKQEINPEIYTIAYKMPTSVSGQLDEYMTYQLSEDNEFIVPSAPAMSGKTFQYWKDEDTNSRAVFPSTVSSDKTYVAVFN